jgi:hypothetical protein
MQHDDNVRTQKTANSRRMPTPWQSPACHDLAKILAAMCIVRVADSWLMNMEIVGCCVRQLLLCNGYNARMSHALAA